MKQKKADNENDEEDPVTAIRMNQLDEMWQHDDDQMYELEDRYDLLMDSSLIEYHLGYPCKSILIIVSKLNN